MSREQHRSQGPCESVGDRLGAEDEQVNDERERETPSGLTLGDGGVVQTRETHCCRGLMTPVLPVASGTIETSGDLHCDQWRGQEQPCSHQGGDTWSRTETDSSAAVKRSSAPLHDMVL